VFAYFDFVVTASGAYSAGQVAGKVFLVVLAVALVVSVVRRLRARSNPGG
jgi:hypothetical protein